LAGQNRQHIHIKVIVVNSGLPIPELTFFLKITVPGEPFDENWESVKPISISQYLNLVAFYPESSY
jgi:hypothetical protein